MISLLLTRLINNIINIKRIFLESADSPTPMRACIEPKYIELAKKENIHKLRELMFGSGNDAMININVQQNINVTIEIDTSINNNIDIINNDILLKNKMKDYRII